MTARRATLLKVWALSVVPAAAQGPTFESCGYGVGAAVALNSANAVEPMLTHDSAAFTTADAVEQAGSNTWRSGYDLARRIVAP
jgi:hypothetical protein